MLSATVLHQAIKADLTSKGFDLTFNGAKTDEFIQSICEQVIQHITSAGVVTIASVSGVTTGPGVSGPGTGVIT